MPEHLVGLVTCDLGVVLELAGGFAATSLAYIFRECPFQFPGPRCLPFQLNAQMAAAICYIKLSTSAEDRAKRVFAWVVAIFGACVMVLSTVLSVWKAALGTKGPKVCS
jgi:solute carrier family 38 (sodium-coupled neutral amino acid transporter), member 11